MFLHLYKFFYFAYNMLDYYAFLLHVNKEARNEEKSLRYKQTKVVFMH